MLKVAILDDYQNVAQQFVDLEKLSGKYEFKIFSEPFLDEADAIEQLAEFEALLIMRERILVLTSIIRLQKRCMYRLSQRKAEYINLKFRINRIRLSSRNLMMMRY